MSRQSETNRIAVFAEKWLAGTISDEEIAVFEQWYRSFDDAEPELLSGETPEELRERLYKAIMQREFAGSRRETGKHYRWIAAAACAALVAFFSFWWVQNEYKALPFVQMVSVHADARMLKTILPDGSIIWLKPGATLKYPASFGRRRRVSLTGEGLFEIAKDARHPFMVSVGNYTATVLGTSFYIKQSANLRDMELSVLTGKVKVSPKDELPSFQTLIVLPDEKLLTGNFPRVKQVTEDESQDYIAGTGYRMDFSNAPFEEVAVRVERKFNVHIRGDLKHYSSCRFTANLTGLDLDYTLELISKSIGITYTFEKDVISISGGGCN